MYLKENKKIFKEQCEHKHGEFAESLWQSTPTVGLFRCGGPLGPLESWEWRVVSARASTLRRRCLKSPLGDKDYLLRITVLDEWVFEDWTLTAEYVLGDNSAAHGCRRTLSCILYQSWVRHCSTSQRERRKKIERFAFDVTTTRQHLGELVTFICPRWALRCTPFCVFWIF